MAISIYAGEQKIFPKIPILTEILVKWQGKKRSIENLHIYKLQKFHN